jgi:proline iminopeptidase
LEVFLTEKIKNIISAKQKSTIFKYMSKLLWCLILSFISLHTFGQEGMITYPDRKIYYRTYGTGKPLLIINGGPGMNSNGFIDLAKKLSFGRQTIIYDQRGTGKSFLPEINSTTITMALMVSDLEELRKHLKIEKWSILGHSFGGMLASYYASIHPNQVEKLILSSSGGIDLELQSYASSIINSRLSTTERIALASWNEKIANGDTSFKARLQRGLNLAPAYVYNKKNIPIIAQRLTEGNSTINGLVWQDLQKINFNCAEKLKSFTQPVLIIQGKQDIVLEKTALKANRAFKNSKVVLLKNCVHYGWLDSPEVYFKEINGFLADG